MLPNAMFARTTTKLSLEVVEHTKELTDLPPELLELIYHCLDSIDDVHSFGRTHSKTHHVIKRRTVYTEIMRSVIARSNTHRFDVQLCKTLDLHKNVVQHFQRGGSPFPASSSHSRGGLNEWETALAQATVVRPCASCPCPTCIPDVVVHDVLARYQGVRVLEDMWLRRQILEPDLLAADATQDEEEFVRRYTCLLDRSRDFEQGDLGARSLESPTTLGYSSLNPDQRSRLYSAVTFVWILNELRWVLTNFVYPSRSNRHMELLDQCRADLTALEQTPLLDQLDQHSIFAFMYHHLLPLHSPVLQDQDSSKLPLTFYSEWQKDAARPSRFLQLFLLAGQTYFQPPDLIDLAVRHEISRIAPYPQTALPATTEQWIRPSRTFTWPTHVAFDDVHHRDMFAQLLSTHVGLINRSSFAQSQAHIPIRPLRRSLPTSSIVSDYAGRYFVDSAVAAVENGEGLRERTALTREIFAGKWQRYGLWSVWWWANSEDKARAIIARWREGPTSPQGQMAFRSYATAAGHRFNMSASGALRHV